MQECSTMAEQEALDYPFNLIEEHSVLVRELGAASCAVVAANERYNQTIRDIIANNDRLREAGVDAAAVASYKASQTVQPPTSLYVI
jgi:hypothetical protein